MSCTCEVCDTVAKVRDAMLAPITDYIARLEAYLGCKPGQERTWVQCVARARWERAQAGLVDGPLREAHLRAADAYLALARTTP